ncbi:MAG: hypothetical protein ACXAB4_05090 [Candidatus Hodarchaeales archaeon]|jgi:hypothetical protein
MSNLDDQSNKKKKTQSAAHVAQAMAANMAANMADPDFYDRHERMQDEVRAKVIRIHQSHRFSGVYLSNSSK